jgi:hypothetical protein
MYRNGYGLVGAITLVISNFEKLFPTHVPISKFIFQKNSEKKEYCDKIFLYHITSYTQVAQVPYFTFVGLNFVLC